MDKTEAKKRIDLIRKIVDRAEPLFKEMDVPFDRLTVTLDLEKADECIPLDFGQLLEFEDRDFAHDIFGIRRHMNRETGKLEDCFAPRCSKHE